MQQPSASESSAGNDSDQDFDPSAEMLVNDFDDEHTLDEEEAITEEDAKEEIDELTKEGNMPIEELLAMYGYGGNQEKDSKSEEAGDEKTGSDSSNQSTSQQSTSQQPSTTNNTASSSSAGSSSRAATATASLVNNMSDYSDSESDEEYSANEDEWRRTIQVGSDYQATIPEGLSKYEDETDNEDQKPYISTRQGENRDILLWKPTTVLDDEQLDEFVKTYDGMYDDEAVLPSGEHNRDDDHALYLLFTCRYNLAEAIQRHENNPNPSQDSTPVRKMMDPWTEEECRAFEAGLRAYGKDFFQIKHNKIATRTVGEVITFYYFWKKTERHDQFVAKYRVEKKKYALHPGTTDYMDRFLDEQENMTLSVMNSLPNNSGLTNTLTSSPHNSNSLMHSSTTSSNHHLALNHLTSPPGGRQSSSSHGLNNSAQASSARHHSSSHHHHSSSHHHHNDSSYSAGATNSVTISGPNMRTINVNATGEPQTILINDADFNGSNQSDKPIVVLSGPGSSSSGKSSSDRFYHHNPSSHQHHSRDNHHASNTSTPADTTHTIVVGKKPVVIDGTWVSSSGGSPGVTSSSPTSLSTPSVSIYKIPNNPSTR